MRKYAFFIFIMAKDYPPESARFPRLTSGITLVLCVYQLVLKYWKYFKTNQEAGSSSDMVDINKNNGKYNWLFVFAATLVYFLLVQPLGYIITTFLFFAVTALYLGFRKITSLTVISLVFTLALYWTFAKVFYVPLPKGILGF